MSWRLFSTKPVHKTTLTKKLRALSLWEIEHANTKETGGYKTSWYIHYNDVIIGAIASQITIPTIVYPIAYSDADKKKHQSSASLAFVRGNHRGPVNSPHKWPVTRKMFPFDDVIMSSQYHGPSGWICKYTLKAVSKSMSISFMLYISNFKVQHLFWAEIETFV